MTPPINLLEKAKTVFFEAYKGDITKMLLWTGTIGWILSAAGQIAGIAFNKQVSKKEKEFLIPQEIADATVNITCFFVLTRQVQNVAKKLVAKGKIITPEIIKQCKKFGIQYEKGPEKEKIDIAKSIQDKLRDLNGVLNADKDKCIELKLSEAQKTAIKNQKNELETFNNKTFSSFEGGIGVIGSLIGSVISGNIITPILRNPMASWKQKNALEREQLEHDAKLYRSEYMAENNLQKQKLNGLDSYRTRTLPSGTMKI